ncbi:unnamed protein product [Rotaria socialis]|uniref:Uncharacterized protein n=1 Tax=Rotaria socialis TaxID=392032 RepID=A0A820SL39_9BILA|nr:unnamed protein product [Rotaria socialis]CAF3406362.1 unnamed protein product [Rotaria socialis]CAF3420182.1 unnamed protein product [Rotaria socialis]CAF3449880.1 unnamed protein product [Rotaria socialis]CAF3578081.1 unnamed protein product [Rotaria socialis]
MTSLLSSLCPVKKYAIERSFVPLVTSSESFVVSYDEYPRPLIRLFNSNCCQVMCLYLPSFLVDMCYSCDLDSFIFLSTTSLYKLNPSIGKIEFINDYHLLKENRSMSSICSTNDQRLFILYRFGEYLDTYPRGKRIWKRRHLCDSISEDIFLIRSSKDDSFLLALLIVEWNGIWRVDIFSPSLQKLHTGFRFNGWTRDTWLSEWSSHKCWFVGSIHRLMINTKGQSINIKTDQLDSDISNITWIININNDQVKMIVTRGQKMLTFLK